VIASHYAEPVERRLRAATTLRSRPSTEAEALRELEPGEPLLMLDDSLGWAWGYAGKERCVGYAPSEALAPQ
jgi:dipeptidyl peptidase-like protein